MAEPNGNGNGRRNWTPIIVVFISLAVPGLIAWGVTQGQVAAHDKRLDKIEAVYVGDRDLRAIADPINERLRRIEAQLDELNRHFRRPQP